MFWKTLFWWLYGEWWQLLLSTGNSIEYNSYSLQTDYIILEKITVDNFPSIDFQDYPLPRIDWTWFLSRFFRSKIINITWILKHNTELDLQLLIDEFKEKLSKTNGVFKYLINWEIRKITANCTSLNIDKEFYNITWAPFTITLKTTESFFYLENNLTVTDSSAVSPRTIQVNNNWSAISLPQCYLTFSWVTWTNSVSLALNNRTITYSWTISNWDILLIDCQEKQLLLNWSVVEYSWTFPQLELDINSLIFTINWTFTCDYIISYRKNFL